ncbi:hypothetical protein PBCVMA1E_180L [Paramecium bursaria Chlorella virus MA1E]|nr:hypothetical protein PBCVMA1E_180L [Paramecium bursaria Chlorella virus MA1E]
MIPKVNKESEYLQILLLILTILKQNNLTKKIINDDIIMDFMSFPSYVSRIGDEIDFHGDNISKEIKVMHNIIDIHGEDINTNILKTGDNLCKEVESLKLVIDTNGKNINKEMENMRISFENEMKDLKKKARMVCFTMMAVNVASRVFFK